MQEKFSREPPVYAKPQRALSSTSPQPEAAHAVIKGGVDYSGKPPPPLPGASTPSAQQTSSPLSVADDERPPIPAKPGNSAAASISFLRNSNASSSPMLRSRSQSPTVGSTVCVHRVPECSHNFDHATFLHYGRQISHLDHHLHCLLNYRLYPQEHMENPLSRRYMPRMVVVSRSIVLC